MSPIQRPTGYCCLGKDSLFIVRTIRNKMIQCVGRMSSLYLKGDILRLRYKFTRLMLFRERVALYFEHHIEHTDTLM
jgi:hypothetical protein